MDRRTSIRSFRRALGAAAEAPSGGALGNGSGTTTRPSVWFAAAANSRRRFSGTVEAPDPLALSFSLSLRPPSPYSLRASHATPPPHLPLPHETFLYYPLPGFGRRATDTAEMLAPREKKRVGCSAFSIGLRLRRHQTIRRIPMR